MEEESIWVRGGGGKTTRSSRERRKLQVGCIVGEKNKSKAKQICRVFFQLFFFFGSLGLGRQHRTMQASEGWDCVLLVVTRGRTT